jgi:NTE family protein
VRAGRAFRRCSARLRAAILAGVLCLPAAGFGAAECAVPPPPPFEGKTLVVPAGTRVGLALGSGSMHGIAHIGVLQELEARGLSVEVVAGTSVGALVGALWASGVSAERIAGMGRSGTLQDWAGFAGSWQGLFSSEALRVPLENLFEKRPIESWPKRFGAVATNVANGERRVISTGDGATAVRASSAVPVIYRPIIVKGERLVDGALVEPVPVLAARELGADFVIGVDVAYRPHEEAASGLTQYAFQAMHILVNSLAAAQMRSADIGIRLNLHQRFMKCGNEALIASGREAVAQAWPELARELARHSQQRAAAR